MVIDQESLNEAQETFDGTCPFATVAVECGKGCMEVVECNDCHRSDEYRAR